MNYYSFVDNYSSIASVVNFTLLHSCAKTLARKFKLDSRASVFAKFGTKLTPQDKLTEITRAVDKKKKPKLIEFAIAPNYKKSRQFKEGTEQKVDPLKALN